MYLKLARLQVSEPPVVIWEPQNSDWREFNIRRLYWYEQVPDNLQDVVLEILSLKDGTYSGVGHCANRVKGYLLNGMWRILINRLEWYTPAHMLSTTKSKRIVTLFHC